MSICSNKGSRRKQPDREGGSFQINLFFILAGLACFAVCILMETFKYEAMIRATAGKSDKQTAFEVAVLGKYYDNITPLGAGGQPFRYSISKSGDMPAERPLLFPLRVLWCFRWPLCSLLLSCSSLTARPLTNTLSLNIRHT